MIDLKKKDLHKFPLLKLQQALKQSDAVFSVLMENPIPVSMTTHSNSGIQPRHRSFWNIC